MANQQQIRILCADDHPIVRDGLTAVIGTQPDMVVVAEASDGETALEQYRKHLPEIVVMDLRMPGIDGVEATRRICDEFPDARVIVLTTYEGDEDIYRVLQAGARAYLLKDMFRQELLKTIREVQAGKRCIPPVVAAQLAEHTPRVALTPRELEVLELLAEGRSNKEISSALDVATDTIKIHIRNIFLKLNVLDRTQAVVTAAKRGFIRLHHSS